MKKSKIMNIRYNIISNQFSKDSFIAKNVYHLDDSEISPYLFGKLKKKEFYYTDLEIQELFN